jgi:hypothetical protein
MSPKKVATAPESAPVRQRDYTPAPTEGGQIAEDGTHTKPLPEPEWHRQGLPEPKE